MSRRLALGVVSILVLAPLLTMRDEVAAQEGVEGATYFSPTFAWSISWDDDWSVRNERSDDGFDYLALTDQRSDVYFEAYVGFEGDALECVAEEANDLAAQDGVSGIQIGTAADGDPLSGGEATNAYAVYTYTLTGDIGVETDLVEYSECRTIEPGESVLEISHTTVRDAYNDAAPAVQALLAAVALPGDDTIEADSRSGDDGDEDDNNLERLSAREVKSAAEIAAEDVVVFFEEVFEDEDLSYDTPSFEVVEDESRDPCSERAIRPGVGSFYCGLNQTVYFDLELETSDASVGGIASPYYTVGHEAGHDVQFQLGIIFSRTLSVEMELEADCMAGAFLAWEVENERLEEDEFSVLLDLVDTLGDPDGTSASHPQAHGMGSQRIAMVLRGYYNGTDACGTF